MPGGGQRGVGVREYVVEDQARMAELIGRRLAKASFPYDRAATLAEAMEAARQQAYELILLDRSFPTATAPMSCRSCGGCGRAFAS